MKAIAVLSNSKVNNFFFLKKRLTKLTLSFGQWWKISHSWLSGLDLSNIPKFQFKSLFFPPPHSQTEFFPPLFACSDLTSLVFCAHRSDDSPVRPHKTIPSQKKSLFISRNYPFRFFFSFKHSRLYCDKNIHCYQYQNHYSENERFYCRVPVKNQVFCCCFFLLLPSFFMFKS